MCENHGYERDKCESIGCCEHVGGDCLSKVGTDKCEEGSTVTFSMEMMGLRAGELGKDVSLFRALRKVMKVQVADFCGAGVYKEMVTAEISGKLEKMHINFVVTLPPSSGKVPLTPQGIARQLYSMKEDLVRGIVHNVKNTDGILRLKVPGSEIRVESMSDPVGRNVRGDITVMESNSLHLSPAEAGILAAHAAMVACGNYTQCPSAIILAAGAAAGVAASATMAGAAEVGAAAAKAVRVAGGSNIEAADAAARAGGSFAGAALGLSPADAALEAIAAATEQGATPWQRPSLAGEAAGRAAVAKGLWPAEAAEEAAKACKAAGGVNGDCVNAAGSAAAKAAAGAGLSPEEAAEVTIRAVEQAGGLKEEMVKWASFAAGEAGVSLGMGPVAVAEKISSVQLPGVSRSVQAVMVGEAAARAAARQGLSVEKTVKIVAKITSNHGGNLEDVETATAAAASEVPKAKAAAAAEKAVREGLRLALEGRSRAELLRVPPTPQELALKAASAQSPPESLLALVFTIKNLPYTELQKDPPLKETLMSVITEHIMPSLGDFVEDEDDVTPSCKSSILPSDVDLRFVLRLDPTAVLQETADRIKKDTGIPSAVVHAMKTLSDRLDKVQLVKGTELECETKVSMVNLGDAETFAIAGQIAAEGFMQSGASPYTVAKAAADSAASVAITAGMPLKDVIKAAVDGLSRVGASPSSIAFAAGRAAQLGGVAAGMSTRDVVWEAYTAAESTATELGLSAPEVTACAVDVAIMAGAKLLAASAGAQTATEFKEQGRSVSETAAAAGAAAMEAAFKNRLSRTEAAAAAGRAAAAVAEKEGLPTVEVAEYAGRSAAAAGGLPSRIAKAAGMAAAASAMKTATNPAQVAQAAAAACKKAGGDKVDTVQVVGKAAGEAVALTRVDAYAIMDMRVCFKKPHLDRYQDAHDDLDEAVVISTEACKQLCMERKCVSLDARPEGEFGHFRCSLSSTKAGKKGGPLMVSPGSIYQETTPCKEDLILQKAKAQAQTCKNPAGLVRWDKESSNYADVEDGSVESKKGGGAFSKMVWSSQVIAAGGSGIKFKCTDLEGYTIVALVDDWNMKPDTYLPDGMALWSAYCRGPDKVYFQNKDKTKGAWAYKASTVLEIKINIDDTVSFLMDNEVKATSPNKINEYPLHLAVNFGGATGAVEGVEYTTQCKVCKTQSGFGSTAVPNSRCLHGQESDEGFLCLTKGKGDYGPRGWCWTDDAKTEWGSCGQNCASLPALEGEIDEDACLTTGLYMSTAPQHMACKFGVDKLDEGSHCIRTEPEWGPNGWCWVDAARTMWGSCNDKCEEIEKKTMKTKGDFGDDDLPMLDQETMPASSVNPVPEGSSKDDAREQDRGKGNSGGKGAPSPAPVDKVPQSHPDAAAGGDWQLPVAWVSVDFEFLGLNLEGLDRQSRNSLRQLATNMIWHVTNKQVGEIRALLTPGYGTNGFGSVHVALKITLPMKLPGSDNDTAIPSEDIGELQQSLMSTKWEEALETVVKDIKQLPGIAGGTAISGQISATHPYISWSGSAVLGVNGKIPPAEKLPEEKLLDKKEKVIADYGITQTRRIRSGRSESEIFMKMVVDGTLWPWVMVGALIGIPLTVLLGATYAAIATRVDGLRVAQRTSGGAQGSGETAASREADAQKTAAAPAAGAQGSRPPATTAPDDDEDTDDEEPRP
jgi:hypothetical protein